ncbi:uncharacterized protein LTR77_007655 [Saxophila tyrrhenica]|uniref:Copper-fist domain-containing protein n=1 Tax=Saxophila tyrrhenica TaxID=1690608 RepID=A0AAV9P3G6_9PEZI|nr:hypothetical protein LTR77_007655 [Saxophila tyrrhenica]
MVVKDDGSKWACQSCLKGHRVSGCNHTDRELTLVPKKGRPVTQCQHCRQERKKRSAHVSCDCAQPDKQFHGKDKCIHLREAEEKAKSASYHGDDNGEADPAHLARIAEEQGCCCGHGGKCTCALLMREPEDELSAPRGPAVKPKLEKATSEGSITQFKNGHHKPVHRKNHAAHECGMPYRIPMPRTPTDQNASTAARRSVDSLALDTNQSGLPSTFLPPTATPLQNRRMSKSEQPSPMVPPLARSCNGGLQDSRFVNVDFGASPQGQSNQSVQSAGSDAFGYPSYDGMSAMSNDSFEPFPSYIPASMTALPNNNPFDVWPTPTDNPNLAQPALTAASSGTTSEIDELPHMDEYMPSIQEDLTAFDFANMGAGNTPELNRRSLPPGFFGNNDFALASMGNEWQGPMQDTSKAPMPLNRQTTSLNQGWPFPNLGSMPDASHRPLAHGVPATSRPQSRSLGPTSAPDDDILKQLFPDIDESGNYFSNSQMTNLPSSLPQDFGPVDEASTAFTTQPWSDGSLSIPNDVLAGGCDLEREFPGPEFAWGQ